MKKSQDIFKTNDRLMFAQVREDSNIEVALLKKTIDAGAFRPAASSISGKQRRALVIASGGCTAFSLLATTDAEVNAIDVNQAQINLVHLKLKIFQSLGFDEGRLACEADARQRYRCVRDELTEEARMFFNAYEENLKFGLNNCGSTDKFLSILGSAFRAAVHSKAFTEDFLSLNDVERQRKVYIEKWNNRRWKISTSVAFNKLFLSAGRFRSAMNLVPDDFPGVLRQRFEQTFAHLPNDSNPYVWQIFLQRYSGKEDGYPVYLQKDNAGKLQSNLANLHIERADILSWLRAQPTSSLDLIALSNVLELTDTTYGAAILPELKRCARPGACISVRSIFPPPGLAFKDDEGAIVYDAPLSEECRSRDRSVFCSLIQVYRRQEGES